MLHKITTRFLILTITAIYEHRLHWQPWSLGDAPNHLSTSEAPLKGCYLMSSECKSRTPQYLLT